MKLKKLFLKDKPLFDKFLNLGTHELGVYHFANIYIWRGLFEIQWQLIEGNLCLFFQDRLGCFAYLEPLGKNINPLVAAEVFALMDKFNRQKNISRIENVEEHAAPFYRQVGYSLREKFCDYLCSRERLSGLRGDNFKSQRAMYNYFIRHYPYEYQRFSLRHKDDCLALYRRWMLERKAANLDLVYQGMLEDSFKSLKVMLGSWKDLRLTGRVVKVGNEIKGFTFGFRLNRETFCVLYEITDLSLKGLAQFIFRRFCQELESYPYINLMDDSGLENLKKVKLSYRPIRLIPNFIVERRDA